MPQVTSSRKSAIAARKLSIFAHQNPKRGKLPRLSSSFYSLAHLQELDPSKDQIKTICFDLARGFLGRFLITLPA
jgi:hypothetical protein